MEFVVGAEYSSESMTKLFAIDSAWKAVFSARTAYQEGHEFTVRSSILPHHTTSEEPISKWNRVAYDTKTYAMIFKFKKIQLTLSKESQSLPIKQALWRDYITLNVRTQTSCLSQISHWSQNHKMNIFDSSVKN